MLKPRRVQLLLLCSGLRSNQLVQRLLIVSPHGAGSGGRACQVRRHKYSCLTLENTFKCYELENGPPMDVELSREDAITMYTQMVEVRRIEVLADAEYKKRTIRGFCHLYNGQEAVAVGMMQRLRKCDSVITAYRCHAWTYLMGVSLHDMMAELLGFKTGCSRGKGGSMHMYCDKFYGGNGIVGAQVPLGAGVALAHQYSRDGGVCVALYGDGAANQGQIFEAYNMAKLWCLPCIFVCENNHYGMGTRVDRASAMTEFYKRGQYVPGLWVDGNQVLAVRSATQFAVDYALEHGPIVLEMCTYRYVGHSMSDPGISYRSREEVNKVRETRDPIISFRNQMIQLCLATEEEIKKLDGEIRKRVDAESKRAQGGKEVPLEELYADVYSKNLEPKIRAVSGYKFDHIGLADVCFGKPRKTPPSEICDVPVGDAAMIAKAAEDKKKRDALKKAKEGDKKDKAGGAAKKGSSDSKKDAQAKAGGAAKAEKKQPDKPAGKEGPTPPSSPPPPASGGKPPAAKK